LPSIRGQGRVPEQQDETEAYYFQPKGLVRTVDNQLPDQPTAVRKKGKAKMSKETIMAQNASNVEDQDIIDMVKPLTVQNLNVMFQERQDIFEYPKDNPDWKYPKHVKISKTKSYKAQDIQSYNETHVTR
jgi:hypothetical protein